MYPTHLADELIGNGLGPNLVSRECSLKEEPERDVWLDLGQSHDGLQTKLEDTLTLFQPALILGGKGVWHGWSHDSVIVYTLQCSPIQVAGDSKNPFELTGIS